MQKFLPSLALFGKVLLCVVIINLAVQYIPGLSRIVHDPKSLIPGQN